jgi:hypothetical protein
MRRWTRECFISASFLFIPRVFPVTYWQDDPYLLRLTFLPRDLHELKQELYRYCLTYRLLQSCSIRDQPEERYELINCVATARLSDAESLIAIKRLNDALGCAMIF